MSELRPLPADDDELLAEIVDDDSGDESALDFQQAHVLTTRIRQALDYSSVLVIVAFRRRAWEAMDYPSWDAYCRGEFSTSHLQLPAADRLDAVTRMRAEGMSIRAIASATGASRGTVQNDLTKATQDSGVQNWTPGLEKHMTEGTSYVPNGTPEPAPQVTGLDGKSYSPARPPKGEAVCEPAEDVVLSPELDSITPEEAGLTYWDFSTSTSGEGKKAARRLVGHGGERPLRDVMRMARDLSPAEQLSFFGEDGELAEDLTTDVVGALLSLSEALSAVKLAEAEQEIRTQWTAELQDVVDRLGGVLDELNK